jgi:hypothetical protein
VEDHHSLFVPEDFATNHLYAETGRLPDAPGLAVKLMPRGTGLGPMIERVEREAARR